MNEWTTDVRAERDVVEQAVRGLVGGRGGGLRSSRHQRPPGDGLRDGRRASFRRPAPLVIRGGTERADRADTRSCLRPASAWSSAPTRAKRSSRIAAALEDGDADDLAAPGRRRRAKSGRARTRRAATIVVLVCDVDLPREMATLRRLRREVREPAIVAVSPTATGDRRAPRPRRRRRRDRLRAGAGVDPGGHGQRRRLAASRSSRASCVPASSARPSPTASARSSPTSPRA